jgi:hypothetical protein
MSSEVRPRRMIGLSASADFLGKLQRLAVEELDARRRPSSRNWRHSVWSGGMKTAMNWFDVPDGVTQRVIALRVVHRTPISTRNGRRWSWSICRTRSWTRRWPRGLPDGARYRAQCEPARLGGAAAGGGVFWIRNTFDERSEIEWSNAHAMLSPNSRDRRVAAMARTPRATSCARADVRTEDDRRRSLQRVLPGTWDLPYRLRSRGFDTVRSPAR